MTDRSKFEQMLEHLVNDEQDKAKELFHALVVEKSREIYENILSEELDESDEEVEEGKDEDDDETVEENFGFAEAGDELAPPDAIGGDATDDFMGDIEMDGGDELGGDLGGDEMGGEGDLADRVVDLEDALEQLKAEFEELMGDDAGGDEFGGDSDSGDEEGGDDDFGGDLEDEGDDEEGGENPFAKKDESIREYVEKVGNPKHGDDGVNNKSIVAKKNDMGGTTANILKGGEAKGEGTKGGLLNPSTKDINSGNVNVPGGNAGKTAFKHKEPGHGAEKKGAGENAENKKSLLGSRK